jgi:hypothetical protein
MVTAQERLGYPDTRLTIGLYAQVARLASARPQIALVIDFVQVGPLAFGAFAG